MEDLTQLMEQLDLISKSIPEGNYLKMCNNLKNIHQDLRDMRRPRVAAPFISHTLTGRTYLPRGRELTWSWRLGSFRIRLMILRLIKVCKFVCTTIYCHLCIRR